MKTLIKSVLHRAGFEISRLPGPGLDRPFALSPRRDMGAHLRYVKSLGFHPATVIDIGAADGTPPLVETFPDAFHVLVEPLSEFEPQLRALVRKSRGVYRIAAANDTGHSVSLNVHTNHLHGSSLLKEEMGPAADGSTRLVPGLRLDDLLHELHLQGPILLKIDVQGAELIVLKGAPAVLQMTELLLLEVSFFNFLKDGPDFADVIQHMSGLGFAAYDIYGQCYRPLDGALAQVDVCFVRRDSPLRQDHRWASDGSWLAPPEPPKLP